MSQKLNNILFFLSGVLCVVVVGILVMAVQTKASQRQNDYEEFTYNEQSNSVGLGNSAEKWQEGDILYQGEYYRYNKNIRTYLLMGIDKDGSAESVESGTNGGQSDAMFLLVVDSENQKLSVISIHRNTMTEIEMYDQNGIYLMTAEGQICLQHAYGDGRKLSCTRTVDAVEKLFTNIPISGYIAINMGAIPTLNDSIGGVEVEVLQDLYYPNKNVNLTQGETVTLSGNEAYCYLRGRDVNDFDSASDRLRREEQYIVAYMNQLKQYASGNASAIVNLYDEVDEYIVSSVDFASLAEELLDYEFSDSIMYTVPGHTQMGEKYEEYIVDEDAFEDLLMEVFYLPVDVQTE